MTHGVNEAACILCEIAGKNPITARCDACEVAYQEGMATWTCGLSLGGRSICPGIDYCLCGASDEARTAFEESIGCPANSNDRRD
jgi:hypothetical protein